MIIVCYQGKTGCSSPKEWSCVWVLFSFACEFTKLTSYFFDAGALHLLINYSKINFLVTGAEPFRGDIISTTQYGLDVTFHQDSVTIIYYQCLLSSPPFEGGLRGVGPFATWPLLLPPRGAAASHPYLRPGTKNFKYMIVREAKRVGLRCCWCASPPRRPGSRSRSALDRTAKMVLNC